MLLQVNVACATPPEHVVEGAGAEEKQAGAAIPAPTPWVHCGRVKLDCRVCADASDNDASVLKSPKPQIPAAKTSEPAIITPAIMRGLLINQFYHCHLTLSRPIYPQGLFFSYFLQLLLQKREVHLQLVPESFLDMLSATLKYLIFLQVLLLFQKRLLPQEAARG